MVSSDVYCLGHRHLRQHNSTGESQKDNLHPTALLLDAPQSCNPQNRNRGRAGSQPAPLLLGAPCSAALCNAELSVAWCFSPLWQEWTRRIQLGLAYVLAWGSVCSSSVLCFLNLQRCLLEQDPVAPEQ